MLKGFNSIWEHLILKRDEYIHPSDIEENNMRDYRDHITIEPGKRGGKPCLRSMRITVYDVLDWLASGMSEAEILEDYPELTPIDTGSIVQAHAAKMTRHLDVFRPKYLHGCI